MKTVKFYALRLLTGFAIFWLLPVAVYKTIVFERPDISNLTPTTGFVSNFVCEPIGRSGRSLITFLDRDSGLEFGKIVQMPCERFAENSTEYLVYFGGGGLFAKDDYLHFVIGNVVVLDFESEIDYQMRLRKEAIALGYFLGVLSIYIEIKRIKKGRTNRKSL